MKRTIGMIIIFSMFLVTKLYAQEGALLISNTNLPQITMLAQQSDINPVLHDLQQQHWISEYKPWLAWAELWLNRTKPGLFMKPMARRVEPNPPFWLGDECAFDTENTDEFFVEACRLHKIWKDDLSTALIRGQILTARSEKIEKTKFWERLQLDVMHIPTSSGGFSLPLKGLVGIHYSIPLPGVDLVEIYPAPGFMLVKQDLGDSNPSMVGALTWGLGIRLPKIHLKTKDMFLFLSLAKCWIQGNRLERSGLDQSVNLAGISISWRNRHQRTLP